MLHKAVKDFSNIKVVHHNYPFDKLCNPYISINMHPNACFMSKGAIASAKQNNYWEMSSLLYETQPKKIEDILKLTDKLGFDELQIAYKIIAELPEGLSVVRVPAYSPYAVAEHAMALLLTSIRRIHKAYIRSRDFNFSLSGLTGFDLHGKTVGVIGTGRIGRVFIDICQGFGMKVLAYDKYPAKELDNGDTVRYVTLDELFKNSDIISLHCPLTEETYHIIDQASLEMCKKGVDKAQPLCYNNSRSKRTSTHSSAG